MSLLWHTTEKALPRSVSVTEKCYHKVLPFLRLTFFFYQFRKVVLESYIKREGMVEAQVLFFYFYSSEIICIIPGHCTSRTEQGGCSHSNVNLLKNANKNRPLKTFFSEKRLRKKLLIFVHTSSMFLIAVY